MSEETEVVDIGEDVGFIKVKVAGDVVTVDLYAIREHLLLMQKPFADRPATEYFAEVVEYLPTLGFKPNLSQNMAERFYKQICKEAAELEKKTGVGIASRDSTESIPTDGAGTSPSTESPVGLPPVDGRTPESDGTPPA